MSEAEPQKALAAWQRDGAAALTFLDQRASPSWGVGSLQVPAPVTMDSFFFGIEERERLRVVLGQKQG